MPLWVRPPAPHAVQPEHPVNPKDLHMHITIEINTAENVDPKDLAVLAAISGNVAVISGNVAAEPKAAAPAKPEPKAAAPAKPEPKAAKPEPEPTPEPDDDDLVGGDGPTREDAVALATKLVSEGKAKEVRAVLTDLGAKKVSELADDSIAAFIAALA